MPGEPVWAFRKDHVTWSWELRLHGEFGRRRFLRTARSGCAAACFRRALRRSSGLTRNVRRSRRAGSNERHRRLRTTAYRRFSSAKALFGGRSRLSTYSRTILTVFCLVASMFAPAVAFAQSAAGTPVIVDVFAGTNPATVAAKYGGTGRREPRNGSRRHVVDPNSRQSANPRPSGFSGTCGHQLGCVSNGPSLSRRRPRVRVPSTPATSSREGTTRSHSSSCARPTPLTLSGGHATVSRPSLWAAT